MATLLTQAEIESALPELPGWAFTDDRLQLTTELASFPAVLALVAAVGEVAEQRNHHPDIDIRWRTVTFACTTHSAGGVTQRDVELAQQVAALLAEA
ncbi:4a-hydroxytetrahydrobiopterin dehydratase [Rhodococcus sp. X156]|uniref:4a-hydroxytetrahydrobiopterin dehydratase n=1 Tax=Rhodococcus sp. X156 TaxID=2499145 RepID=UPI000FD8F39F|nr:4a-hydroxytetrahydrobiopterin dehydratase [Rhodococcus sp. X156]